MTQLSLSRRAPGAPREVTAILLSAGALCETDICPCSPEPPLYGAQMTAVAGDGLGGNTAGREEGCCFREDGWETTGGEATGGRASREEGAAAAKALRQECAGFEKRQEDAEAGAEGVPGWWGRVAGAEVLEETGTQMRKDQWATGRAGPFSELKGEEAGGF